MAYFEKFPETLYSLDDRKTVQVVTNITARAIVSDTIRNNLSLFYEYDVIDGETPEIVSDKFYDDPELHWLILHVNETIDPRFEWLLSYNDLIKNVDKKYDNRDDIHHYETSGEMVSGNLYLEANVMNYEAGNVITNVSNTSFGVVVSKISNSNVVVNVSKGGFNTGDSIYVYDGNILSNVNVTATQTIGCTAITNLKYEESLNESRRKIKILKNNYIDAVVKEFDQKMLRV